jgi:hypothetical protein
MENIHIDKINNIEATIEIYLTNLEYQISLERKYAEVLEKRISALSEENRKLHLIIDKLIK